MKKQDEGKKQQGVVGKAAQMAAHAAAKRQGDVASGLVTHAGTVPQDTGVPPRLNRTGALSSPLKTKAQVKDAEEIPPSSPIAPADLHLYCAEEEQKFGLMGTMPPPVGVKGVVKAALKSAAGQKPTVLLDMIGDRLAFERTGTRLYDALIAKVAAKGSFDGGPTAEELMHIRDEELQHFHLLVDIMRQMGGDPTAVTPTANVSAVASKGILDVVADPRATVPDALHAIHVAELTDADGWRLMIALCDELGLDDVVEKMREAEVNEAEHLALVRRWMAAYLSKSAQRERPIEEEPGEETGVEATT